MRLRPFAAAAAAIAALGGCSRNVLFTNPQQRVLEPVPSVVSIVYDRYGDLYPGENVPVREAGMRAHHQRLLDYFKALRDAGHPDWTALQVDAGVRGLDSGVTFDSAWTAVQNGLRGRAVRALDRNTRRADGSRRTLFVLVHGFNNTFSEAEAWYQVARDSIARRVKGDSAVFLDVHWDGLTAPFPPGIWESAQYNFPLVGLEFRRVLNVLDPAIPVRILTHSSGGPLVASTMGDASAALTAHDAAYERYYTLVKATEGEYRPPRPLSFRVGMIAPAASTQTFDHLFQTTPGPDRLVLGLNPLDYATTKLFLSCDAFGSSCLATRLEQFCTEVAPIFSGRHTRLYAFDFSRSRRNRRWLIWDDHAMVTYLQRDDISRFLDLLVRDDDTGEAGEAPGFCSAFERRG